MVAVSTPDAEERRWAQSNLEGVSVYADYDGMLGRSDLDAIVVASVTSVHAEQTMKAIGKGYHVLCEKPISLDLAVVSPLYSKFAPAIKWMMLTTTDLGTLCHPGIRSFAPKISGAESHVRIFTPLRLILPEGTRHDDKWTLWSTSRVPFSNGRSPRLYRGFCAVRSDERWHFHGLLHS